MRSVVATLEAVQELTDLGRQNTGPTGSAVSGDVEGNIDVDPGSWYAPIGRHRGGTPEP